MWPKRLIMSVKMVKKSEPIVTYPMVTIYSRFLRVLISSFVLANVSDVSAQQLRLTLDECTTRAIEVSEQLKRSDQDIAAAEARYQQAVAEIYPNVFATAGQRFRNSEQFGRVQGGGFSSILDPGTGENDDRGGRSLGKNQFDVMLTVRQPIFTGFRNIILSRVTVAERDAEVFIRDRRREELRYDVAEVFYQVLLYRSDLEVLGRTEKVLVERTDELKQFLELGKARESELLAAQSELSDLFVSRATTERLRGASKELLAFLIHAPSSSFELVMDQNTPPLPPLDRYLERAAKRADIEAAKLQVEASEQLVLATEREHWPEVALEGNVFPYEDPDRDRKWELFFTLDWSVFDSGRIDARVQEREAEMESARLVATEQRRIADREVRVAWSDYQTTSREVDRLRELLDAAQKNYRSQKLDYANGVVTNLEVLAAIRQMQEAERRLQAAEITLRLNQRKLDAAAGGVS